MASTIGDHPSEFVIDWELSHDKPSILISLSSHLSDTANNIGCFPSKVITNRTYHNEPSSGLGFFPKKLSILNHVQASQYQKWRSLEVACHYNFHQTTFPKSPLQIQNGQQSNFHFSPLAPYHAIYPFKGNNPFQMSPSGIILSNLYHLTSHITGKRPYTKQVLSHYTLHSCHL